MPQFHLIAPSGYCINQEAAQRGVQRLLEMGHQVENQTITPPPHAAFCRYRGAETE
jgi:murein tetrapeptidase LD-carboxypeptidase (EC:3.4.17.13). Serine peptidase. MEROPS family S66